MKTCISIKKKLINNLLTKHPQEAYAVATKANNKAATAAFISFLRTKTSYQETTDALSMASSAFILISSFFYQRWRRINIARYRNILFLTTYAEIFVNNVDMRDVYKHTRTSQGLRSTIDSSFLSGTVKKWDVSYLTWICILDYSQKNR